MSIWNHLDRKSFENNTKQLLAKAPHQGIGRNEAFVQAIVTDQVGGAASSRLPTFLEARLANDIAFLTAWESAPERVAGATIECNTDINRLTISIAANGGIPEKAQESMRKMLNVLRRCAACDISRESAADQSLDILLRLHRDRIFERLGLHKQHLSKKSTPQKDIDLAERVVKLRGDVLAKMNISKKKRKKHPLISLMDELLSNIQAAKDAPIRTDSETLSLKAIILTAHKLTIYESDLLKSLRSLKLDVESFNKREIRHIHALGNYGRICRDLAQAARLQRRWFQHVELNCIIANKVEVWGGLKHFVHAEIQLLVYHETNRRDSPGKPKFIGTSKMACFLCNSFIRAYGHYMVNGTHGDVHNQWTVPDSKIYTKKVRSALGMALSKTASDVKKALKASNKNSESVQQKSAQSVLNLPTDALPEASAFTLVDQSKMIPQECKAAVLTGEDGQLQLPLIVDCEAAPKSDKLDSRISPSIEDHEHCHQVDLQTEQRKSVVGQVSAAVPLIFRRDWLEIFVESEAPCDLLTCDMSLSRGQVKENIQLVDVDKLQESSKILGKKSSSDTLDFIVTDGRRDEELLVQILCIPTEGE